MVLPLNFDILLVLSIGFFLLFTAFNTAQSLSVTVLNDNDFGELGFYSLAVLYLSFGVSSFFAAPIVKRCGERTSMVVASLAYVLFTAVFILPALRSEHPDKDGWLLSRGFIRAIIILTSILNGVGAGVLWVAQGTTIAKCASDQNKGLFNSIFMTFYQLPLIIGNLISAYVVTSVQQSTFFVIMTVFAFSGTVAFVFVKKPKSVAANHKGLLSIDATPTNEERQTTVTQDIRDTWKMLRSKRMCILVPLIFAWAAGYAIIAAALVPMMTYTMDSSWDSDLKNKKALLALIGLGIGEVFGSLLTGRILDKFSTRFTVYANALVTASAYLVILAYARHNTFSMGFACFMTFVWGWQDAGINCFVYCILGFQFDSKTIPFSAFRFLEPLIIFGLICFESSLKDQESFEVYFCCTGILSVAAWIIFDLFFPMKSDKKKALDAPLISSEESQIVNTSGISP